MTNRTGLQMYDEFADVYDALMDDFDYDAWGAYYLSLIRNACGELPRRAVECACGTGSLTVRLAAKRHGGDGGRPVSRHVAERRSRRPGSGAWRRLLSAQDMRNLAMPRRVGAVLATCDGVNYLTTPQDVRAFFDSAYAQFCPGGVLCFDCSTRHKLEDTMGDAFFGEERDGMTVLWQNRLNRESHVISMDLTFFVREQDGRYRRFREQHRQRAHSEEELTAWLQQAGFEQVRAFGEMRETLPTPQDLRMHLSARKPL